MKAFSVTYVCVLPDEELVTSTNVFNDYEAARNHFLSELKEICEVEELDFNYFTKEETDSVLISRQFTYKVVLNSHEMESD